MGSPCSAHALDGVKNHRAEHTQGERKMWTTHEDSTLKSHRTEEETRPSSRPSASLNTSEKRTLLSRFVQDHLDEILQTLCIYVYRAGLAQGPQIRDEAQDLLHAVTEHALHSAERFDHNRRPMAWLLGIAANLILQEKHKRAKQARREPLLFDLASPPDNHPQNDSFSDILPNALLEPSIRFDELLHDQQAYLHLLAKLPPQDQEILHLSIIQHYSAKEIAQRLQSSPGAIRVRIFRALKRLREHIAS